VASIATVRANAEQSILSAFQYPSFRLYFIGQLISVSGTWMQKVAQGWLVFSITQSEIWLGLVACAAGLSSLLLSPFGGVLADRFPRRHLMLFTQSVQMTLAFILATLVLTEAVQVWHIVVLAFFSGMMDAIDAPSRLSIVRDMVGRETLQSAITMNSVMMSSARVIGPVAAGLALIQFGPVWCFFINGASFLFVIGTLCVITVAKSDIVITKDSPLAQLWEGVRFARHHSTIAPLLLLTFSASVFMINTSTLFPAFADLVLNSPKEGYATLSAAHGLGSVIAGLLSAVLFRYVPRGYILTFTIIFTPLMICFGALNTQVIPAAVFIGLSGFGIILMYITLNTLIQTIVPDEFRGRILSLYTISFFGIAPFGALVLGIIASVVGTSTSLIFYALLGAIMSIVVLTRVPAVARLT
jgi:MFS family permease